jgi:glutamine---fructose-6-phosphate transaminase (isomerizing)
MAVIAVSRPALTWTGAHELLDPLCQIQAFYLAAAALAGARGLDPDAPRRLKKVTKTL